MTLRDLRLFGARIKNVYLKTKKGNEAPIEKKLLENYYDYEIVFANGRTKTVIIEKGE